MSNCYIIIHQGIGDLFNSIGIINYYSNKYNNIFVFVLNNINLEILSEIFFNNKNIIPIIPDFVDYNNTIHPNTCINCMTNGNENYCPRNSNIKCKYINYDNYNGYIIKIGSFNYYEEWTNFRLNDFSYVHSFYNYNGLNPDIRLTNFILFNDKEKEKNIYNNFIKKYGNNYILIHEDTDRNMYVDRNKILNKNLPIININKISNYYVDYLEVIKNSKEIHLIYSSWSMFIFLLSYKLIDNKIFLHKSNIIREDNIYKNPDLNNIYFI
jgi:hypothetical protein